MEIYEPEAQVVKLIYQYYLGGEGYKLIASRLNDERRSARKGKPFGWKVVEGILANETYTGTLKFQEIRIPDIHPVIIEKETWQKVQEERKRRDPKKSGSSIQSIYLFSGLLH